MPTAYVTAPPDAARDIAELLVEERLAACVNLVECESVYRWEDEVVADEEVILLAKTTDAGYGALAARVSEVHPYDVPAIERFEESGLAESFREWRDGAVGVGVD